MEQTDKRSHHADKVSSGVPQRAPHVMSGAWVPLSRAALMRCACCPSLPNCAVQHQCTSCQHWKTAAHMHGKQCRDCYNQEHSPHPTAAAAAAAPPSLPSPLYESILVADYNGADTTLAKITFTSPLLVPACERIALWQVFSHDRDVQAV